ncbi:MAG: peptide chain release factor N(5)-glutamine methyltransferase [Steroidobacteraceae bacterium]
MPTDIRTLIDEGAARLARRGDDPRRDAEILLGAALGLGRAQLYARMDEVVTDCDATDRYEALVTRRARGVPVAHLLGVREFWSLALAVTPAVLVPRPETELLVERAIAHLPPGVPLDVLDLGTGSGAVGLAIASERPACRVECSDVSPEAIAVATRNAGTLGLANVRFLTGDWFAPCAGRRYDLVAGNPPYIADGDARVAPDVHRHEPQIALYAGPTGLEAIARIVADAPAHLRPGGVLALEHGDRQGPDVRQRLAAAGFVDVATYRDLAGLERCTEGRRPR